MQCLLKNIEYRNRGNLSCLTFAIGMGCCGSGPAQRRRLTFTDGPEVVRVDA